MLSDANLNRYSLAPLIQRVVSRIRAQIAFKTPKRVNEYTCINIKRKARLRLTAEFCDTSAALKLTAAVKLKSSIVNV